MCLAVLTSQLKACGEITYHYYCKGQTPVMPKFWFQNYLSTCLPSFILSS